MGYREKTVLSVKCGAVLKCENLAALMPLERSRIHTEKRKDFMDIRLNDVLVMKKPHPCGEKRWLVMRTGADFRLRCLGCGHELMTPRFKAEKNIRSIERPQTSD